MRNGWRKLPDAIDQLSFGETSWFEEQKQNFPDTKLCSGQIEKYFTNLDFPEIRGPISLPKRYLLGAQNTCEAAISFGQSVGLLDQGVTLK